MQVIKQILVGSGDEQTIKMVVRDSERGPQGEQGEPGTAATIAAGNAYSVPSTSQPAVINTGTSSAAVFDFYIPKGEQGDKGDTGAPGTNGKDGAIQYTAGAGIKIENNTISAIGGGSGGEWGYITGDIADQTDLQQEFAKYTPSTGLATVATTGAYSDLSGTPSIPAAQVNSDWNATTGVAEILNKPTIPDAQIQSDWGQSDDTKVDYIKNKPTIPTVNNATLTITSNGTSAGTFTANASTDVTIALTSPTITMTTTDPGEGSPLAANNFVAVYSAS